MARCLLWRSLILWSITLVDCGFCMNINGTAAVFWTVPMKTTSNIYQAATNTPSSPPQSVSGFQLLHGDTNMSIFLSVMVTMLATCAVCCLFAGIFIGVALEKRAIANLKRRQEEDGDDGTDARRSSASSSQQVCIEMNTELEHDSTSDDAHVNVHVPGSLPAMSFVAPIPLPMSMIAHMMDAHEESRSNESLYDRGEDEEEEEKRVDLGIQEQQERGRKQGKHVMVNSESAVSTTTGQNLTTQASQSSIVDPGDTNQYEFDNIKGKIGELSWQQSTISPNRAYSIRQQNSYNGVIYPAEGKV